MHRKRSCVLMLSKCRNVSVGEVETAKKSKTTPDAGGKSLGKSVSEKSQDTCTSKNPFEKSRSKKT